MSNSKVVWFQARNTNRLMFLSTNRYIDRCPSLLYDVYLF
ncbi:hypothetical protein ALC57_11214 [Trachymyrmex cornetzi]|uniref:Uncharacterized protein n=1 Tax=Trachymyrmex cornetzi TaxID=471704 RepID=A0A151J2V0_9HYME|nr:hypothetical protein ALC57_11214 [Trachymyrmex cornetzi]